MTAEEARTATFQMLTIGVILLGVAGLLWYLSHPIAAAVFGLLGLLLGGSGFARKSLVAPCPFCGEPIHGVTEKAATQGRMARCNECFEYSYLKGMKIQPMDPATVANLPRFVSPVFEGGVWPQGCVLCGEPSTRLDTLKYRTLRAAPLLVGQLWLQTSSMKNVPYCAQHKDAVELSVSRGSKLDLKWRSLRMMRRYLAANRGRTSRGSKIHFNVDLT